MAGRYWGGKGIWMRSDRSGFVLIQLPIAANSAFLSDPRPTSAASPLAWVPDDDPPKVSHIDFYGVKLDVAQLRQSRCGSDLEGVVAGLLASCLAPELALCIPGTVASNSC